MKKFLYLILILAVSVLLAGVLIWRGGPPPGVIAEIGDNVSGFAWSENIGWISMNCRNIELTPPLCNSTNYGVNIESDGNLTGYAWSETIGWIDFAPAGPYPQDPQYSAKTDSVTGVITGWARALAYGGGWDGWISMSGSSPDYGVSIDTSTGEFSGWAWGSDVMGWLHFAYSDGLTNYKTQTSFTFNNEPVVNNLSVYQGNYCLPIYRPIRPTFNWTYSDIDGDDQDSYQVLIDDDLNIEDNPLIDSCATSSGSTCLSGNESESYTADSPVTFDYGTITYYWGVRVWDDRGGESALVTGQFTTPQHQYPNPDFEWTPLRPSIGEFIQFCATAEAGVCATDISKCYNVLDQQISCSGNIFEWTFPPGTEFSTTTSGFSENPKAKLPETGWQIVTLRIDDGVGNCSVSKDIRISAPFPKWQEVAP